jgi:hypothetical protein
MAHWSQPPAAPLAAPSTRQQRQATTVRTRAQQPEPSSSDAVVRGVESAHMALLWSAIVAGVPAVVVACLIPRAALGTLFVWAIVVAASAVFLGGLGLLGWAVGRRTRGILTGALVVGALSAWTAFVVSTPDPTAAPGSAAHRTALVTRR